MSKITISKAKITKNGCLEVNYLNDDGDDITLKGCNPVHPDLKSSLKALVPYLADITEQKEAKNIDWSNPTSEENNSVLNRLRCPDPVPGNRIHSPPLRQRFKIVSHLFYLSWQSVPQHYRISYSLDQ